MGWKSGLIHVFSKRCTKACIYDYFFVKAQQCALSHLLKKWNYIIVYFITFFTLLFSIGSYILLLQYFIFKNTKILCECKVKPWCQILGRDFHGSQIIPALGWGRLHSNGKYTHCGNNNISHLLTLSFLEGLKLLCVAFKVGWATASILQWQALYKTLHLFVKVN